MVQVNVTNTPITHAHAYAHIGEIVAAVRDNPVSEHITDARVDAERRRITVVRSGSPIISVPWMKIATVYAWRGHVDRMWIEPATLYAHAILSDGADVWYWIARGGEPDAWHFNDDRLKYGGTTPDDLLR